MQLLRSPQVRVGDTGATTYLTFSKEANKNQREPTVTTTGIIGEAIRPSIQMDIDCMHCDKHGNKQFDMTLTDVCHLQGSNLNLLSLSRILNQGWKMAATEDSIIMRKGALKICFDLVIPTKHGALYCDYFKYTGEV